VEDAARDEVTALLRALVTFTGDPSWSGLEQDTFARLPPGTEAQRWAASGGLDLTGDPDGQPTAPSAPVASRLAAAGAALAACTARLGSEVTVDAPALLAQRATLRGLCRQGAISVGGGCRLLPTADGWVAVSLNRQADWELLSAALGRDLDGWQEVAVTVGAASTESLITSATELGLAMGAVPPAGGATDEQWRSRRTTSTGPWVVTRGAGAQRKSPPRRVLDLTALWAGPLCGSLLRQAGADVITVESTARTDGARSGDPELHKVLHDGNTFASLDFSNSVERDELRRLVDECDVVISSARMRALQQLGLDPFEVVDRRPGLTWVGISAYGLTGPWSNRIGYGDDTAVAGGLLIREPTPTFCADAIADPVTGLYAAIAALAVSASGGGVVDAALRDAAAHVARPEPGG